MSTKYKAIERLGTGGMGSAILATDLTLQREVVIKVMHDHLAQDNSFRERFIREARAIARLRHPNVVRILTFSGENQAQLYLVMDYYEDGNLRKHIENNSIALTEGLDIARQMASALHYAHQQGMIHRDVKPENILLQKVSNTGENFGLQAILADFGLVKLNDNAQSTVGTHMGTWAYMPPESFGDSNAAQPSFDIYSLGIVLFELVFGQRPYDPQSMSEAFTMHTQAPLPNMDALRSDIPVALKDILRRCLEKNPVMRYSSAFELEVALTDLLSDLIQPSTSDNNVLASVATSSERGDETGARHPVNPLQSDMLLVRRYNQVIVEYPIDKTSLTIGREPQNDIFLSDKNVSRRHAELTHHADGTYSLTDLDSTHGTRLMNKLNPHEPAAWSVGVPAYIGDYELLIVPVWVSDETGQMQPLSENLVRNAPVAGPTT